MFPIHSCILGIATLLMMCGCQNGQSETMFDHIRNIENHRASQSQNQTTDDFHNSQDGIDISDNEVLVVCSREHPTDISDDDIVMTTRDELWTMCWWSVVATTAMLFFGRPMFRLLEKRTWDKGIENPELMLGIMSAPLWISSALLLASVLPSRSYSGIVSCEVIDTSGMGAATSSIDEARQDAGQDLLHNA